MLPGSRFSSAHLGPGNRAHDAPQLCHGLVVRDDLRWPAHILGHEHERSPFRIGIEEAPIPLWPEISDEHRASLFVSGKVPLPDQRGEGDRSEAIRTDLPDTCGPKGLSVPGPKGRTRRRRGALNVRRGTRYLFEVHLGKGGAAEIQVIGLARVGPGRTSFPSQCV